MTEVLPGDPMYGRVSRFAELRQSGTALAFIDSVLPGHLRANYAVVGDTAVENPDFRAALQDPHRFQIGLFEAPPSNGPAWHTHDYVELFIPLTGRWSFDYGTEAEGMDAPDGTLELEPWDAISFPPGLWRAFRNVSEDTAWGLAVLDPHDVFTAKDPIWPQSIVDRAAERGLAADDQGRMIRPENSVELEGELQDRIRKAANAT